MHGTPRNTAPWLLLRRPSRAAAQAAAQAAALLGQGGYRCHCWSWPYHEVWHWSGATRVPCVPWVSATRCLFCGQEKKRCRTKKRKRTPIRTMSTGTDGAGTDGAGTDGAATATATATAPATATATATATGAGIGCTGRRRASGHPAAAATGRPPPTGALARPRTGTGAGRSILHTSTPHVAASTTAAEKASSFWSATALRFRSVSDAVQASAR